METATTTITVETTVKAPIEQVWKFWTEPKHIVQWNSASPDWHTPRAENDLRVGGKFTARMEARDGSFGFDFEGVYDAVEEYRYIEYTIGDGRKVQVYFTPADAENETKVVETFEAEGTHSVEMQKGGWQAIMDNFKKHAETASL